VATPTCAAHGAPLIAPCARCGVFLCSLETHSLDGATYCATCIARPDVDIVSAYRLHFWGRRRDAWSWIFGAGATFSMTSLMRLLTSPHPRHFAIIVSIALVFVGVQLAWFMRQRWARVAVPAVHVAFSVVWLAVSSQAELWERIPLVLLICLFLAWACLSVPSRLFFKFEVPREKLSADWRRYHRNALAYVSVALALAGYWYPWLWVPALGGGLFAFLRTRGRSLPPARGKWPAISGLLITGNGLAGVLLTRLVSHLGLE
jgi:hypothetical protein